MPALHSGGGTRWSCSLSRVSSCSAATRKLTFAKAGHLSALLRITRDKYSHLRYGCHQRRIQPEPTWPSSMPAYSVKMTETQQYIISPLDVIVSCSMYQPKQTSFLQVQFCRGCRSTVAWHLWDEEGYFAFNSVQQHVGSFSRLPGLMRAQHIACFSMRTLAICRYPKIVPWCRHCRGEVFNHTVELCQHCVVLLLLIKAFVPI